MNFYLKSFIYIYIFFEQKCSEIEIRLIKKRNGCKRGEKEEERDEEEKEEERDEEEKEEERDEEKRRKRGTGRRKRRKG